MPKNDRTTTFAELAILASSCGLVSNDDQGRQAFTAWLAKDQKAARKALFTRIDARRAAAKTAQATQYPAGWRRAAGIRSASAGQPPAPAPTPPKKYPGNWLRATAIPAPRGTGPRVVEARD